MICNDPVISLRRKTIFLFCLYDVDHESLPGQGLCSPANKCSELSKMPWLCLRLCGFLLERADFLTLPVGYLVCRGLIKNGERQDEESVGGRRRTEALRHLCKMNPSQALRVRGMVVSLSLICHKNHNYWMLTGALKTMKMIEPEHFI